MLEVETESKFKWARCLMFITTQKEEFSYAYISAVASAAGYSFQIAPRPLDLVGVDVTIAVGGNSQRLQFICFSATIGNPQEMALRFSGRTHQPERLHLIARSGTPSAGRTFRNNSRLCGLALPILRHCIVYNTK